MIAPGADRKSELTFERVVDVAVDGKGCFIQARKRRDLKSHIYFVTWVSSITNHACILPRHASCMIPNVWSGHCLCSHESSDQIRMGSHCDWLHNTKGVVSCAEDANS